VKKNGYPKETQLILAYSRHVFKWTPEGDKVFKDGVRTWVAERRKAASQATKA
jgi:hypothetical protein